MRKIETIEKIEKMNIEKMKNEERRNQRSVRDY